MKFTARDNDHVSICHAHMWGISAGLVHGTPSPVYLETKARPSKKYGSKLGDVAVCPRPSGGSSLTHEDLCCSGLRCKQSFPTLASKFATVLHSHTRTPPYHLMKVQLIVNIEGRQSCPRPCDLWWGPNGQNLWVTALAGMTFEQISPHKNISDLLPCIHEYYRLIYSKTECMVQSVTTRNLGFLYEHILTFLGILMFKQFL